MRRSAANPARLSELGSYAIWSAVDTLGPTGGVVQLRAVLYPEVDGPAGYPTAWITVTVDPNGDGPHRTSRPRFGEPAHRRLHRLRSHDADEFGLSVRRVASSREPTDGWVPQGERLTANQQQISTDLTAVHRRPAPRRSAR